MNKCCNNCKHKEGKYTLCKHFGTKFDWSEWYVDTDYCSKWEKKEEERVCTPCKGTDNVCGYVRTHYVSKEKLIKGLENHVIYGPSSLKQFIEEQTK